MKRKNIFKQLLLPTVAVVMVLAISLAGMIIAAFTNFYEQQLFTNNKEKASLMAGEIAAFLDGAYGIVEELSVNPSILTMETKEQNPILEGCVERNPYFELLYVQGADGMQTGRSSGELADRSTRWWFKETMEEQQAFISESYYSVNTGMPCASIFFPMYRGSEMTGVFAADLKLNYLQGIVESLSDSQEGNISFVIDGEGIVVAHPDSAQIEELYNYKAGTKTVPKKDGSGAPVKDEEGIVVTEEQPIALSEDFRAMVSQVMAGGAGSGQIRNDGEIYYASYASIPLKGSSDSWSIISLQKRSSAMSAISRMVALAAAIALVAIALAVVVMIYLARKLTNPIVSLTELIQEASQGDFTKKADENVDNELGELSESFNKMTEKLAGILTKITTFTGKVVQSSGRLREIELDMNSINKAAEEISKGMESQTEEVAEVVSYAAELEEKFRQLKEKNQILIQDAKNTMLSGGKGEADIAELESHNQLTADLAESSYARISTLEEQSHRISDIIESIRNISTQTQLLALNASIEAARAGEQGRGFAVVADSIGKLAVDSTAATADIEGIIAELCQDIQGAVSNVEEIRENIREQVLLVQKVQSMFHDFKELAEKTERSVGAMEELIDEMHRLDNSMVDSANQIQGVSENAALLSDKMQKAMEEQLEGICLVSGQIDNLSDVSGQIEQELTKFKLEK